jgi:hypothetical protein
LSGFLLDANCISEVVSLRPEPRVLEWMDSTDERLLYISVLTLGAIRKGLAELPVRFSRRILPVDAGVADR